MLPANRRLFESPQLRNASDNLQLRTNAWYKPIHNVDATGLAVSWISGLKVLRLMKPRCKIDAMVNMMKNLLPVPQVQHTAMEKLQISKVSRFVVFKNLVLKTFKALPIRAGHKMLPKKMNSRFYHLFADAKLPRKPFWSQACCSSHFAAIACSSLAANSQFFVSMHSWTNLCPRKKKGQVIAAVVIWYSDGSIFPHFED